MKQTTTVMQTYEIEVRETRIMVVPVTAESTQAAIDRVKEAHAHGEIDLDGMDTDDATFKQV